MTRTDDLHAAMYGDDAEVLCAAGWVIWESIQCFDGEPDHFGVLAYVEDNPDFRDVLEMRHLSHAKAEESTPKWRCFFCKKPSAGRPGDLTRCANFSCGRFTLERNV